MTFFNEGWCERWGAQQNPKILIFFDGVVNWDGVLEYSGMLEGDYGTHFCSWIETYHT
jgi:hypothetical protein